MQDKSSQNNNELFRWVHSSLIVELEEDSSNLSYLKIRMTINFFKLLPLLVSNHEAERSEKLPLGGLTYKNFRVPYIKQLQEFKNNLLKV